MNNLDNIKETKEIGTLTKKELEMMNVLWQSETALTASEILKASTNEVSTPMWCIAPMDVVSKPEHSSGNTISERCHRCL